MSIFDKLHERYDRWYEKHKKIFLKEVETVKKINFSGRGIEIGVGTGRFASLLNVKYGIDPSLKMLLKAKERGIKVIKAKGEFLPFKSGIFDFALIIVTICFVKEPLKVLNETRRILKTGGKVIVGIIDKNSILGKEYQKKESPFYKEAKFYSSEDILEFFKKTGFEYTNAFQFLILQEQIKQGFNEGGFVAISGIKK